MTTIDVLYENILHLEKENNRLKEVIELQNNFLNNIAEVLEANNKLIKKLAEQKNNYLDHNKLMLEIIKGYSAWDKIIIEFIETSGKQPPREGPATIYLRAMGLLEEQIPKDKN